MDNQIENEYRLSDYKVGDKVWYHHPHGRVLPARIEAVNLDGGWLILRGESLLGADGLIGEVISTPHTSVSRRSS
jgi:hypothetical protein